MGTAVAYESLEYAIRAAWLETPKAAPEALVDQVMKHELALVHAWMTPKLLAYVRVIMRPAKEPDSRQQWLPGFEHVPRAQQLSLDRKLPLKKGTKQLGEMTVTELKQAIEALQKLGASKAEKRLGPQLAWLQDLVNQMSPYSQRFYAPGKPVTVERYCDLKAAGTPVPKVRPAEQRRDEAKTRWANRPKAARSAQALKSAATLREKKGH